MKNIRDVIREEQGRGARRQPVDMDEIRRRAAMKRAVRRLIENRDVEGLANALRENGWSDDEPEFQEILKILRRMRP